MKFIKNSQGFSEFPAFPKGLTDISVFNNKIIDVPESLWEEKDLVTLNLSANQIEFVDLIIDALSKNGRIDPARLYEQPFTRLNDQGLSGVFDPDASKEIIRILKTLNGNKAA